MGGRRVAVVAMAFAAACNALNGAGDLELCANDCADAALPDAQPGDGVAPPPQLEAGEDAGIPRLGTGRSGALALPPATLKVVATNAAITSAVAAGDRIVHVDTTNGFASGDLVMLWQTSGFMGATPGAAPVALGAGGVGHYELVRVAAVDVATLTLVGAAASAYPVAFSQVVRVPEYTDVTIPAGAVLRASPWDGKKGGMLAFLATGVVNVDGTLDATGVGFRGGVGIRDTGFTNCTLLDGIPGAGYAAKGEGIALGGYATDADGGGVGGRGNVANGAGGGDCHNGAGAGGGHGGVGGPGATGNGMGGIGGASLAYAPLAALAMGGGGGAGDSNDTQTIPSPSGGAGGGVIFVRARALIGKGLIGANGVSGIATNSNDGSGGGGAGGLVALEATESIAVLAIAAVGAATTTGGANSPCGGGGGGGVVVLAAPSVMSVAAAPGGAGCGTSANLMSGAGADGRVEHLDGG